MADPLLVVRDLVVEFSSPQGALRAVNGVSFDVYPEEVLGIVGESGSGKSLTMLAVMGLLPPGARVASGTITFRGRDMVNMSPKDRSKILGKEMAMIFQDPMTSLNPVIRVGHQLAEMVRAHDRSLTRKQVRARAMELLEMVRIPDPRTRYSSYPHEFSGGMRQRVMIAMAVAHSPGLLIADEPTTALDVTIQAQVLRVLSRIRGEVGASMTLITHDLGLIAETADRIVVMYGGRVVESGTVQQIFATPRHPYTVGLLASALRLDTPVDVAYAIPGQPPPISARPSGCVFRPRCGLRQKRDLCAVKVPALLEIDTGGSVACHFHTETARWASESTALRQSLPASSEARS
jgi:oligopeptide/dipeptide ABC transporter ATP-binding protein